MFVETKREGETPIRQKPSLSLAGMIAWLETQNPHQPYEFQDCHGACMIAQYMKHAGVPWAYPGGYVSALSTLFGDDWWKAQHTVAGAEPHTFGDALKRVRAFADK